MKGTESISGARETWPEEQKKGAKGYKTLLLNLPHESKVIRRYMCSYNAPNVMFPPLELISLGGIVRAWKEDEVYLLDAIAEELNVEEVLNRIEEINPHLIVSITGFECIDEDMKVIDTIKSKFPSSKTIIFGHYATQFAEEILDNIVVDYIILGEPDLIFSELYDCLKKGQDTSNIKGIVYKGKKNEVIKQHGNGRIPDPNILPMPSYELLKFENYYEPFMQNPFVMIQTARGCPYACNYCVKSFGRQLTTLEPQRIINEILLLKEQFNIKSIRFIDDTFTVNPKRVIELCRLMIDRDLDMEWSCLARADTVNDEMLMWMKKAGCKRIFFGIESGSQKILDYYNKEIKVEEALTNLLLCSKYGIETVGWFMVGMPNETREDFEQSVEFAIKAKLNYILVSELIPYPGTPLFEILKDQLDFSLFPYRNVFKDAEIEKKSYLREKEFFRRFYFRPTYVVQNFHRFIIKPSDMIGNFMSLAKYLWSDLQLSARKDFA